jgi:hypothetical protein
MVSGRVETGMTMSGKIREDCARFGRLFEIRQDTVSSTVGLGRTGLSGIRKDGAQRGKAWQGSARHSVEQGHVGRDRARGYPQG